LPNLQRRGPGRGKNLGKRTAAGNAVESVEEIGAFPLVAGRPF
jgi:hypothetical protein